MSTEEPADGLRRVGDAAGQPVYYDDGRGTYHAWYDGTVREPVSTALIEALSAIQGVDPLELDTLASAVEPDALNALLSYWDTETPHDGTVSFTYARHDVTVHSSGELVIEPL